MRNCRPPKPLDPSSISWDITRKSGQEPAPKKLPETDAIFAQVKQRNEEADKAAKEGTALPIPADTVCTLASLKRIARTNATPDR